MPPADRPPATIVHWAFDVMLGAASALALLSVWFLLAWWRRRDLPRSPWFLRACAGAGVLAMLALEAGWVMTEVGRQPWVVYGYLRTAEAVTHAPRDLGIVRRRGRRSTPRSALSLLVVLRAMSRRWRGGGDDELPGPTPRAGPWSFRCRRPTGRRRARAP